MLSLAPGGFRRRAVRAFEAAEELNLQNIAGALGAISSAETLLDLGCDDGERTLAFAAAARAQKVLGVETVEEQAERARTRGVEVTVADLNAPLSFDDDSIAVIVSNQVIEHLHDTDRYVSEIRRVLRPGGHAVISTENLASWHNVFALLLGWQPFSLTNVSAAYGGLGNPLAIRRGDTYPKEWEHLRVFAFRGLVELFELNGLVVERVLGAGYYPFPAAVGARWPRHAAFLTVVARKP